MKRFAALLAIGLIFAACSLPTGGGAATPPPPAPEPAAPTLDPVGVYDFTTEVEEQIYTGTITFTGSPGAYSGSFTNEMMGTVLLQDVEVSGMEVTFLAYVMDATVAFLLTFEGESYTAEWKTEDAIGFISGHKKR